MATKKITTDSGLAIAETKPTTVERIVTSDRGVGRIYKEASSRYVVHA